MAQDITFGDVQKKIDTALDKHEYYTTKNQIRYFLHNFLTYYLVLNGITNVERKKSKDANNLTMIEYVLLKISRLLAEDMLMYCTGFANQRMNYHT